MIFKWLAIAFLAAMITGPASAQTTSAVTHKEGEWRGSKLAGVNVYNEANEKIGDINDVIVDRSGKVSNVILGVGGVLGLGEHYVAVPFDKLKWVDQLCGFDNSFNNVRTGERACHYFRSRRHHANHHGRRSYHHDYHHNQCQ
jgi:sporulation protein YlmC with PRC-barrel domain